MKEFDLVVIGGSSSGVSAALSAAASGVSVTLVVQGSFDSTDAARQALVQAAHVFRTCRDASEFGIHVENTRLIWNALKLRIADVRDEIEALRRRKLQTAQVEVLRGNARFEDLNTLRIESKNGEQQKLRAQKFILATDSASQKTESGQFSEAKVLSAGEVFALPSFPRSLIIIGHDANACEFAQAFAQLGSKVTLLACESTLLPETDVELSEFCLKILEQEGVAVHLSSCLKNIKSENGKTTVEFESGGETLTISASELLMLPQEESTFPELNLAAAGAELEQPGGVSRLRINEYFQAAPNVWVCGTGSNDFEIAVQNALSFSVKQRSREMAERVVFTTPEIATIGVCEAQAREKSGNVTVNVNVYTQNSSESERAIVRSETRGFLKIITDRNGKILGAHLAGLDAGALIRQFTAAIQETS